MKRILLFVLILFTSKNFAQIKNVLSKKNIINHKIEEILVFDVFSPKNSLFIHNYYDHSGNILQEIYFNKDGTIWYKHSYQYDEQQKRISSLNEMDNKISTTTYNYDTSGNLIEYKVIKPDNTLIDLEKNEYNEKNQKIKTFRKKKDSDDLYLAENISYTDDGLISKEEGFDESGKLNRSKEFEYDNSRKLIFSHLKYNSKIETTKCIYNEKGELTKSESSDEYTIIKYDRFGNKIKATSYYKNRISLEQDFKYDKFGKLIEDISSNINFVQHRKYEYKTFE